MICGLFVFIIIIIIIIIIINIIIIIIIINNILIITILFLFYATMAVIKTIHCFAFILEVENFIFSCNI